MNSSILLQLIAVLVSIVVAAGNVCALIWGVWTYRRNANVQIQMLALETLQHHLDIVVAHPDLAIRDETPSVDARYAWFAAHALTTAQTLWLLVGSQPSWQLSIDAIVRQHRAYLRSGMFVCSDYTPDFVGYLRTRVAELKCAEPNDGEGRPS